MRQMMTRKTHTTLRTALRKTVAVVTAFAFFADFAAAAPALAPLAAASSAATDSAMIVRGGKILGLEISVPSKIVRRQNDGSEAEPLDAAAAKRLFTFLSRLPADDPETAMALSLRSYLEPRMPKARLGENRFLAKVDGRPRLTELGKTALVDIITASDGELLVPIVEKSPSSGFKLCAGPESAGADEGAYCPVPEPAPAQDPLGGASSRIGRASLNPHEARHSGASAPLGGSLNSVSRAAAAPGRAFDGGPDLGSFDWKGFASASPAAGKLNAAGGSTDLSGYSIDEDAGTVRVLVGAGTAVREDRFKLKDPSGSEAEVYAETGLDRDLLAKHGAKLVRAVDNIVTVDVPLPEAEKLGLALRERGIMSRPARAFRSSAAAFRSPAASLLAGQFLPVPTEAFGPSLNGSRFAIGGEKLAESGMKGEGTVVGIIDSGLDANHPDFKGRIEGYLDFTGEGTDDVVGHGTHVAGTIGGTGAASEGKYKGLAERTRFKIAKVFGNEGETDESVLLAAVKWMAGDEKKGEAKADILNMSLGGPGDPDRDPLTSYVNDLVVKKNVLVVAAAGNDGPYPGSVSAPGNSRYALTVGGITKDGRVPFYSSRGPIYGPDGREAWVKPDVLGVGGDVDLSLLNDMLLEVDGKDATGSDRVVPVSAGFKSFAVGGGKLSPLSGKCIYKDGIIAPRSSKDPDNLCTLEGNPNYRFMSGTSMATPMVTGMSAGVIGYLKSQKADYDPFQVKAAIMETSGDLGFSRKDQGSGLVSGERLAKAVIERVKYGLPVGNVAYALAARLTDRDRTLMKSQTRYEMTEIGILDTRTGRLINNETDLQEALEEIRRKPPLLFVDNREVSLNAGRPT